MLSHFRPRAPPWLLVKKTCQASTPTFPRSVESIWIHCAHPIRFNLLPRHFHHVPIAAAARPTSQAIISRILAAGAPSPREAASYVRKYDLHLHRPDSSFPPSPTTLNQSPSSGGPSSVHIALVQLQWPLSPSAAENVAANLVALHRLAVTPIIVVDLDPAEPPPPSLVHDDGTVIDPEAELDEVEFTPSTVIPPLALRDPASFRSEQITACDQVARALHAAGAIARPLPSSVFHLVDDSNGTAIDDTLTPPAVDVTSLQSCLDKAVIPVLAPLATTWSTSRTVPLTLALAMTALAKELGSTPQVSASGPNDVNRTMDPARHFVRRCLPSKLVIVNRARGGIPDRGMMRTGAVGGRAFINLAMEFDSVLKEVPAGAQDDLAQAQRVLSVLPPSATAVIASAGASAAIVSHYLTDKPLVAVSLPHRPPPHSASTSSSTVDDPLDSDEVTPVPPVPAAARQVPPTVLRLGVPIRIVQSLDHVNILKLTHLLESSFGRQLDADRFYTRIASRLHSVVIAGDYSGAAIITLEGDRRSVPYLDKFAVSPKVQSGGVADILWMTLRDDVCRDGLVWRSRADNKVNPWYFARSDGMVKLGAVAPQAAGPKGGWAVFWFGGQGAHGGEGGWQVPVEEYVQVAKEVPASFVG
ncbi:hypothetical protein BCR44DRAFT_44673 [Catenaria anguillulae PL171]|uniref:Amino-acid acetyltransferase, mitochondrial n=1 Tax=Catenaria anguillulae PL171 TaxID=765915 RepID=A0A1Y2HRV7_9FUNG|nr:hypothetical protein BCR44DRAFT_44673 [Catenaria anguillulae PL171]